MSEPSSEIAEARALAPAESSPQVDAAYLGVATAFTLNGLLLGSWAPRIPEVQERLGLSHGELGLTLLALAVGSLGAMPVTGWVMARFGSGRVLLPTTLAACLLPGLIGAADSVAALWPVLLLWGMALGAMDVSMNAQAVVVQDVHPRTVINSIHACFSLGGLLGAALGTVATAAGVSVAWHLAGTGLICLLASSPTWRNLLPDLQKSPSSNLDTSLATEPTPRLLGTLALLCAAAFSAMLAEGAITDWSAIRMKAAGAPEGVAGIGYTIFALAMFIGRASGDTVAKRFGHARMAVAVGLLGCAAALAGFALPGPAAAVLAFAALGLGLSCIMPFLFTLAGAGGLGTSVAVTAVSTSGYIGLLVGPSVIGALAEVYGIVAALWILPVLLLLSVLPALRTALVPVLPNRPPP